MIEHIEKSGKIEKTGDYNIYKIGNSVTTKEDEDWANMRWLLIAPSKIRKNVKVSIKVIS